MEDDNKVTDRNEVIKNDFFDDDTEIRPEMIISPTTIKSTASIQKEVMLDLNKPEEKKPEENKPEVNQPEMKKPEEKKPAEKKPENETVYSKSQTGIKEELEIIRDISDNRKLRMFMDETQKMLVELKMEYLLPELAKIQNSFKSSKFTVAVVGEFSRGKSTFINHLLGKEALPTGNLPTTAMLTRITHSEKPHLVYAGSDGRKMELPIKPDVWDGLTANLNGKDPQGVVYLGMQQQWLRDYNLQIIDTPGAGDLNDARGSLVNDAILSSDAVIITISALAALSMTEKLFIEQRILTKKVPHLMLILTRLDQVTENERTSVIQLVKNKLRGWKTNIPVFIPQNNIVIPSGDMDYVGLDKIKNEIQQWIYTSNHYELRTKSCCLQILNIFDLISKSLEEQKNILSLDETKKANVLKQQKLNLNNMKMRWDEIDLEMMKRSEQCYQRIKKMMSEKQGLVIERIQYDLSHSNNPKNWWECDYPYKLKMEIIGVAASLETTLNQMFFADVRWLNDTLLKEFQMNVKVDNQEMNNKEDYTDSLVPKDADLEDLSRMRLMSRVGTGAATLLTYVFLGPFGSVASIGGGIISELLIGKTIDKQKETLNELIEKDVPSVIDKASSKMEKRLQKLYDNVLEEAKNQENIWEKTQTDLLNKAYSDSNEKNTSNSQQANWIANSSGLNKKCEELSNLKIKLHNYMEDTNER